MTYTKKMHKSVRRETQGKNNIVTDLLDEIERLNKEHIQLLWETGFLHRELEKFKAADFWTNIVYPEGATAEQVQNELNDYHTILDNVSKVYDHITGGRISKPNTLAYEVISVADDYYDELKSEDVKEELKYLQEKIIKLIEEDTEKEEDTGLESPYDIRAMSKLFRKK
jgi:hypothetical protein